MSWDKRPVEVANLFNPAFCSILLREAVNSYQAEQAQGLPYVLAFLLLPTVLHQTTRDSLPGTKRTKMHVWLQNNPEILIGFASRAKQFAPITRETIIFSMKSNTIALDNSGYLVSTTRRFRSLSWEANSEPAICYRKSQFLGRWFAQSGETSTILTMWGVRPPSVSI
ncbi:MAG: hypothetical protein KF770_29675 [Anaerolineae bacterium]|nr:hypothetical protein [Anaerolineae bacterium]